MSLVQMLNYTLLSNLWKRVKDIKLSFYVSVRLVTFVASSIRACLRSHTRTTIDRL